VEIPNTSSLLKCKSEKHHYDAAAAARFHPLRQRQMAAIDFVSRHSLKNRLSITCWTQFHTPSDKRQIS
jgi:hypothetical protein